MTRARKRERMIRRLSAATSEIHGFGRGPFGDAERLAHIQNIARVVEEARRREREQG